MAISQEIHHSSITKINMKITHLKCHQNLPGANELISFLFVMLWRCHDMGKYSTILAFCEGNPPVTSEVCSQRDSSAQLMFSLQLLVSQACYWTDRVHDTHITEMPSWTKILSDTYMWISFLCGMLHLMQCTCFVKFLLKSLRPSDTYMHNWAIGADNGLTPDQRQAIILTNA